MDSSIASLLASVHKSGTHGKLVSVIDEVLDILMAEKRAWKMRLPPKFVGIHPQNRSGWGCSPTEVHRLGSEIVNMGFSFAATSHAVAVEDDGTAATFSESLTKTSEGRLGCDSQQIKFASLSCTHTNQFLTAVLSSCPSDVDHLTEHGCLSYSKLAAKDANLKAALDHGLEWLVIGASVVKEHPTLPDLVQAARNATGAVMHKEDAFQLLQRIASMASETPQSSKGDQHVDWAAISGYLERRGQATAEDLRPLIAFAATYGGRSFIDDLARFAKAAVPSGRIVPSTTWQALAQLKLSHTELCPHFVFAVIKAQASCPQQKCDGKYTKYISPSEISSLAAGRKADMLAAEKVLAECRLFARARNVAPEAAIRAFGRLDVFVVRLVLGKKEGLTNMNSIADVAKQFTTEITGAPATSDEQPAGVQSSPNVVRYDQDGAPIAAGSLSLQAAGFAEGSVVKCTSSPDKFFSICRLHADGSVSLKCVETGAEHDVTCDDFVQQYRKSTATFQVLDDWEESVPSMQNSHLDTVKRSQIQLAMHELASTTPMPKLKVTVKPVRSVQAAATYGIGKLVLVPETTRVQFDGTSIMTGTVGGVEFALMPSFSENFVVPAWAVQTTDVDDKINMVMATKKVLIKVANKEVVVNAPVLQNSKKLKAGDVLFTKALAKAAPVKRTLVLKVGQNKARKV